MDGVGVGVGVGVFVEAHIEEEKVFDGAALPKTLMPLDQSRSSVDDLVTGIDTKKDFLCEMLTRHGAVLFRGFGVDDGSDFRRVVEAFGWDEMPYVGPSPRVKVDERVYTASESPLHLPIDFHSEMSLMKSYPSKIFFCCEIPPPFGGETSLARSTVLLQKMEKEQPEFVQKLEREGFIVDVVFPNENSDQLVVGQSLKSMLNMNNLIELEKRAKEIMGCSSVEFTEDGNTKVTFGPLEAIRTLQGKKLWFSSFNKSNYGRIRLPDGSLVPQQVGDTINQILDQICVDIKWQKGDVILVDNYSTQHARRPGKPPRKILVSICK